MFTLMAHFADSGVVADSSERLYARDLFERASRNAQLRILWQRFSGKTSGLLSLKCAGAAARTGHRTYLGVRSVPLNRIRGTENREHDFDAQFRPLSTHTRERWMHVLMAMRDGVPMPPVELIQVGDIYYVRDGHHRISASRLMGRNEIEAEITLWEPE